MHHTCIQFIPNISSILLTDSTNYSMREKISGKFEVTATTTYI